jgi:hypothetical protein
MKKIVWFFCCFIGIGSVWASTGPTYETIVQQVDAYFKNHADTVVKGPLGSPHHKIGVKVFSAEKEDGTRSIKVYTPEELLALPVITNLKTPKTTDARMGVEFLPFFLSNAIQLWIRLQELAQESPNLALNRALVFKGLLEFVDKGLRSPQGLKNEDFVNAHGCFALLISRLDPTPLKTALDKGKGDFSPENLDLSRFRGQSKNRIFLLPIVSRDGLFNIVDMNQLQGEKIGLVAIPLMPGNYDGNVNKDPILIFEHDLDHLYRNFMEGDRNLPSNTQTDKDKKLDRSLNNIKRANMVLSKIKDGSLSDFYHLIAFEPLHEDTTQTVGKEGQQTEWGKKFAFPNYFQAIWSRLTAANIGIIPKMKPKVTTQGDPSRTAAIGLIHEADTRAQKANLHFYPLPSHCQPSKHADSLEYYHACYQSKADVEAFIKRTLMAAVILNKNANTAPAFQDGNSEDWNPSSPHKIDLLLQEQCLEKKQCQDFLKEALTLIPKEWDL